MMTPTHSGRTRSLALLTLCLSQCVLAGAQDGTSRRPLTVKAGAEARADDPLAQQQPPRPPVTRPPPAPARASPQPTLRLRGTADVGYALFSPQDSFEAVYGSNGGVMVGGGVQAAHRAGWFVEGRVSRFAAKGERVFVFDGQVFPLGIATSLTLVPIDLVAGWRFLPRPPSVSRPPPPPAPGTPQPARPAPPPARAAQPTARARRFIPYVGGGVGALQMKEQSADGGEVSRVKSSLNVVGGVEFPVRAWLGASLEGGWRRVPDALVGTTLSEEFRETSLDHFFVTIRLAFGR